MQRHKSQMHYTEHQYRQQLNMFLLMKFTYCRMVSALILLWLLFHLYQKAIHSGAVLICVGNGKVPIIDIVEYVYRGVSISIASCMRFRLLVSS